MINSWRKGDVPQLIVIMTDYGMLLMTAGEWSRRTSYSMAGAVVVTVKRTFSDSSVDVLVPADMVPEFNEIMDEQVSWDEWIRQEAVA